MKKALLILHQKRSQPGDIGKKLINRGFILDIRKPCLGDKLPNNLDKHSLVVIFGGPMSVNDSNIDFIKYEIEWINIVLKSKKPFLQAHHSYPLIIGLPLGAAYLNRTNERKLLD